MCSLSAATSFNIPNHVDPDCPTTVFGIDEIVAAWVAKRLDIPTFGPSTALGVVRQDRLIAGVVFNNYHQYPSGATIEASIAAIDPHWATRAVLRNFFSYPFLQMNVGRLGVTCRKSNKHARKFVTRLGFKLEGIARRLWDGKQDAAVYSMLAEECKWLTDST